LRLGISGYGYIERMVDFAARPSNGSDWSALGSMQRPLVVGLVAPLRTWQPWPLNLEGNASSILKPVTVLTDLLLEFLLICHTMDEPHHGDSSQSQRARLRRALEVLDRWHTEYVPITPASTRPDRLSFQPKLQDHTYPSALDPVVIGCLRHVCNH
jgi:hypothetical protein